MYTSKPEVTLVKIYDQPIEDQKPAGCYNIKYINKKFLFVHINTFCKYRKTTRIASRASGSPYRGHFLPFGGLFATLFLHVGAFLLRFSPYRAFFAIFLLCVLPFFGLAPPYENFCGRPSVAYLGFHFGEGGSTYYFEKWGNCMARTISKKSRLYKFNNICSCIYSCWRGCGGMDICCSRSIFNIAI